MSLPGPHGFVAITPKGITKERACRRPPTPLSHTPFHTNSPQKIESTWQLLTFPSESQALQGLLAQLSPGMTAGNCIAFGDGMNDLGMLAWAGIGIAMENAG